MTLSPDRLRKPRTAYFWLMLSLILLLALGLLLLIAGIATGSPPFPSVAQGFAALTAGT